MWGFWRVSLSVLSLPRDSHLYLIQRYLRLTWPSRNLQRDPLRQNQKKYCNKALVEVTELKILSSVTSTNALIQYFFWFCPVTVFGHRYQTCSKSHMTWLYSKKSQPKLSNDFDFFWKTRKVKVNTLTFFYFSSKVS